MVIPLVAAATIAAPGAAQDTDGGFNLMEEGAKLFLRGLMEEMEPALDELQGLAEEMEPALRDFAQTMGPHLRDLARQVEDWTAYHPPEILPNGDIILRRKTDEERAIEPDPESEIEL
ncbi:hypothetical protein [Cognatishimia sp. F0-27]|uniref:hypothetical protein n=1 Tax=Cognatishimia sp. F0-27 TaxID=2816855 RepID=UPI00351D078F